MQFNEKSKNILIQIFYGFIVLLIFVGIYAFSWFTKDSLTTVNSCSGAYMTGEYSIEEVKRNCPSTTKDGLKKSINEYFDDFGSGKAFTTREIMLMEVEKDF